MNYNYPDFLQYTKDHEWVKIENNVATIGITDFAQSELGDIVYLEIETEGETIAAHEIFGTVEAVKTVSDLYMPVGGKITEVNQLVRDTPSLVNEDPYGDGWIIKVEMDSSDTSGLMNVEEYKKIVE